MYSTTWIPASNHWNTITSNAAVWPDIIIIIGFMRTIINIADLFEKAANQFKLAKSCEYIIAYYGAAQASRGHVQMQNSGVHLDWLSIF